MRSSPQERSMFEVIFTALRFSPEKPTESKNQFETYVWGFLSKIILAVIVNFHNNHLNQFIRRRQSVILSLFDALKCTSLCSIQRRRNELGRQKSVYNVRTSLCSPTSITGVKNVSLSRLLSDYWQTSIRFTLTVMVFFIVFPSVFCFFFFLTYTVRSKTFEFKGRPAESVHPFNRVRDATRRYL